jgi:hypothetical protein
MLLPYSIQQKRNRSNRAADFPSEISRAAAKLPLKSGGLLAIYQWKVIINHRSPAPRFGTAPVFLMKKAVAL